ncbi:MATE family efflux transporter [Eubacterium sp.]|uniref:MATE family efflux transporter n=1 Tax=Eubacterium sp. TaxID=142586 RepID=UPI000735235B|nr:MATE family efflux transporter [Eubacterium sp.]ALU16600.1 MatE efflux family protein [Eubacterium limosum]MDO5432952.1 MATE family efflux transporter [Eubacterium sp.]
MDKYQLISQPVPKLFFQYLIPAVSGTMVSAVYILADTIIIGKGIGATALAALNIVLPLFNIIYGAGLLFGVGGSVLMSICRGRGHDEKGQRYFTAAFLLNLLAGILYISVFFIFEKKILVFLGGTPVTMPYIMSYAPYLSGGALFLCFSTFLQAFVRNDGAPRLAMTAVITGGIFNLIFDILLVFPLQMGMAGAALASVTGTALADCILLSHFFTKKNGLRFRFKGLTTLYFKTVFSNGFTSFLTEISTGIVIFVFNLQLLRYVGDIGVSAYGVISNTAYVVAAISNGISQAAQPILSTNYGASKFERIGEVRRIGIKTSLAICAIPAVFGIFAPGVFTHIFLNPTAEVLALSTSAIRIYFIGFFVIGINIFMINYFQSVARPKISFVLCLLRGCILNVLFVSVLPLFWGVNGIWMAAPLTEFTSLGIGVFLTKKISH